MTITEFATLVFKSPPDLADPTLQSHFQTLSDWQSDCSGFPLAFFTDLDDPHVIHLVSGWQRVEAHEVWIRGERNQELLRLFAPYVDMSKIRMVHLEIDFEDIPRDAVQLVVERHQGVTTFKSDQVTWELSGRDLAENGVDVYRFVGMAGAGESGGAYSRLKRLVVA